MSKYKNTKIDGYDSKKEATRAQELGLLERAGQIRNLREQVKYELIPKQDGERACVYVADFAYEQRYPEGSVSLPAFHRKALETGWHEVVEDSKPKRRPGKKSFRMPADYIIKRKLMLYVHGISIVET